MAANPFYNPTDAGNLPGGLILTRAQTDQIMAAFVAGGGVRMTSAQILAITGPAPALVTSAPEWKPEGQRQNLFPTRS